MMKDDDNGAVAAAAVDDDGNTQDEYADDGDVNVLTVYFVTGYQVIIC